MNIVKRTPFRDFENLVSGMRWPWPGEDVDGAGMMKWRPSVDISEEDREFLVKVEIPEVRKEDLRVEVENGVMTVSGERKEESSDKKRHRTERFYGRFERSFSLPENVREDEIKADMKDGMLYIHLAKAQQTQGPRKHQIEVS